MKRHLFKLTVERLDCNTSTITGDFLVHRKPSDSGTKGCGKRKDIVPDAIIAGVDMFLFYNDIEEDQKFMKDAYLDGRLTEERLNEAVTRILALKAHVGMANFDLDAYMPKEALNKIGLEENKKIAREVADKGITLVKHTEDIFPIQEKAGKRVLLVSVGPHPSPILARAGMGADGSKLDNMLIEKLGKAGFTAEKYVDPVSKMVEMLAKMDPGESAKLLSSKGNKGAYGMKQSVAALTDNYDLVICYANVSSTMRTTQRLEWAISKGGWDNPWYVNELPVIFVSFNCPFHLIDVPQIKNFINCYDANEATVDALIDKLTGKDKFLGTSPVDAFCGLFDTKF